MKLLVFCVDALCASDIPAMRGLPGFSYVLNNGALVEKVYPVFPALTYSCHTSILTGRYVAGHGIAHNEILRRGGGLNAAWHGLRGDVLGKTLLDYAKENGLTTCSLSWPVSGGADIDMNFPMIVPYGYKGYEPERWLDGSATKSLMDRYFYKHGRHIKGPARNLDLFTMAVALDILEDFPQPDIMLVKLCDLDGARHTFGVYHEAAATQLRQHDMEFCAILEALRRRGTLDETNVVVLGDHGQTDIDDVLLMNELLRQEGLLRAEAGVLKDYDALCHSTGLAAYVELRDPQDAGIKCRVRAFLESLRKDPKIALGTVMDAEEAYAAYQVRGPFDFVIESERRIAFGESFGDGAIWGSKVAGDHKIGAATHGGSPYREEVTTFMACGPAVQKGVVVAGRPMVDEAPTMAGMLGFTMDDIDGKPITEILR